MQQQRDCPFVAALFFIPPSPSPPKNFTINFTSSFFCGHIIRTPDEERVKKRKI